jgi:HEPN domain-containing protein
VPGSDPSHWLFRLSADEWLSAARTELSLCATALAQRAYRTGITHARRGAGMAINAVLIERADADWGRSYMDHLAAVARAEDLPEVVRKAAAHLVATQPRQPELINIGKPDTSTLDDARTVVAWVESVHRESQIP